jgi:glutathione S-transferase
MANQLKLYGDIGSQGTRAVMTLLAIGKIPYEFVKVDLMAFEARSKKYLELNPFGHIPFLIDGDFKLSESNAILVYICEKYPSMPQSISGKTIQERANVNKFLSWYQNEFRPIFFEPIFRRLRYLYTNDAGNFTP